jgi:hypothetical protein
LPIAAVTFVSTIPFIFNRQNIFAPASFMRAYKTSTSSVSILKLMLRPKGASRGFDCVIFGAPRNKFIQHNKRTLSFNHCETAFQAEESCLAPWLMAKLLQLRYKF